MTVGVPGAVQGGEGRGPQSCLCLYLETLPGFPAMWLSQPQGSLGRKVMLNPCGTEPTPDMGPALLVGSEGWH